MMHGNSNIQNNKDVHSVPKERVQVVPIAGTHLAMLQPVIPVLFGSPINLCANCFRYREHEMRKTRRLYVPNLLKFMLQASHMLIPLLESVK